MKARIEFLVCAFLSLDAFHSHISISFKYSNTFFYVLSIFFYLRVIDWINYFFTPTFDLKNLLVLLDCWGGDIFMLVEYETIINYSSKVLVFRVYLTGTVYLITNARYLSIDRIGRILVCVCGPGSWTMSIQLKNINEL